MLTESRIERLKAAGFRMGDAGDFLELSDAERQAVELRAAIALNLRRMRKQMGLSQTALAKRMGSSQSRIAQIEKGAEGSLDLAFRAFFAAGGTFDPAGLKQPAATTWKSAPKKRKAVGTAKPAAGKPRSKAGSA